MKKYFVYCVLSLILLSNCSFASDVPMLQVQTKPKQPVSNINHHSNYYNFRSNNCCNTSTYHVHNCLYSTTLTTSELRAYADAQKEERLKTKCKLHNNKYKKCKMLTED